MTGEDLSKSLKRPVGGNIPLWVFLSTEIRPELLVNRYKGVGLWKRTEDPRLLSPWLQKYT